MQLADSNSVANNLLYRLEGFTVLRGSDALAGTLCLVCNTSVPGMHIRSSWHTQWAIVYGARAKSPMLAYQGAQFPPCQRHAHTDTDCVTISVEVAACRCRVTSGLITTGSISFA
jgi:hypothetical protein